MKKKIICFFVISTVVLNFSIQTFATNSNNTSLAGNKIEFDQVNDDIKALDTKISTVQGDINEINKKLYSNKEIISSLNNEIKSTELKIESSNIEISKTQEILSLRLRESYKSGFHSSLNYISFIFESNGFSDLISRLFSLKKIVELDNKMVKDIQLNIDKLNKNKESIKSKINETNLISNQINNDLVLLKEKESSILKERKHLQEKKSQISNQIKTNEENLVNNLINIINSDQPSLSSLNSAVRDLKGLLPQITTSSVINLVQASIKKGEELIKSLSNSSNNSSSDDVYKATYTMNASAYYGHTITAMGTVPVRDPNGISTVAVDPKVIPLGSKLFIPNYGYAIAADTGGIIKGMKIDLFMNSREEALSFGRRNITVHLIAHPGEW